jgi:hypothetical protein
MGANVQLTSHRLLLLFCEPLALSMNFPSRETRMAGPYLSGIFDGHQKIGPLPFQQFHVFIYTGTNILKSSGDRCPTRTRGGTGRNIRAEPVERVRMYHKQLNAHKYPAVREESRALYLSISTINIKRRMFALFFCWLLHIRDERESNPTN